MFPGPHDVAIIDNCYVTEVWGRAAVVILTNDVNRTNEVASESSMSGISEMDTTQPKNGLSSFASLIYRLSLY